MISVTEIILIIIGFVIVVLGYVLPAGKGSAVDEGEIEEMVQDKLDRSLNDSVRRQIDGMAQDAVADAIDDNRLSLSRISNEKVMEISEYAGTVLDDIKKNHDEVVFMYDMLNDKHKNLTSAVSEMTRTAETAKQTVRDAELTARDAKDAAATLDAATARAREVAAKQSAELRAQAAPAPQNAHPTGQEQIAARMAEARELVGVRSEAPGSASQGNFQSGVLATRIEEPEAAGVDAAPEAVRPAMRVIVPQTGQEQIANAAPDPTAGDKDLSLIPTAPEGGEALAPPQTTAVTNGARAVSRQRSGAGEPMSQNRQILEMHNAGKSNMVIARELGLGIGEVRLVIDLSKKQMRTKES